MKFVLASFVDFEQLFAMKNYLSGGLDHFVGLALEGQSTLSSTKQFREH